MRRCAAELEAARRQRAPLTAGVGRKHDVGGGAPGGAAPEHQRARERLASVPGGPIARPARGVSQTPWRLPALHFQREMETGIWASPRRPNNRGGEALPAYRGERMA
jgi:hypothetical protein